MTVSITTDQKIIYNYTTAGQTDFNIPFTYLNAADVHVVLRDETVPLAPVETIIGSPNIIVGSPNKVRLASALLPNQRLLIKRIPAYTQMNHYDPTVALPVGNLEWSADDIVMMIQALSEILTRAPKMPQTYPGSITDLNFPEPQANGIISWDSLGQKLQALPLSGLLLTQNQYRADNLPLAQGVTSATVVFSSALPDTNYAIMALLGNAVDSIPDFQPVTVVSKSTTGFTVKWNDPTDSANYVLNWQALGKA